MNAGLLGWIKKPTPPPPTFFASIFCPIIISSPLSILLAYGVFVFVSCRHMTSYLSLLDMWRRVLKSASDAADRQLYVQMSKHCPNRLSGFPVAPRPFPLPSSAGASPGAVGEHVRFRAGFLSVANVVAFLVAWLPLECLAGAIQGPPVHALQVVRF